MIGPERVRLPWRFMLAATAGVTMTLILAGLAAASATMVQSTTGFAHGFYAASTGLSFVGATGAWAFGIGIGATWEGWW